MIDLTQFMMDSNYILKELKEKGIVLLKRPKTENEILNLANSLGEIVPDNNGKVIQVLKAKQNGCGIFGSFSYEIGLKEFPWHTDTSFWDIPVRWLLLFSKNPSACTTNYLKLENILRDKEKFKHLAHAAIFKLRLPTSIFLMPFLFNKNYECGYRYDQHIMAPFNKAAFELDKCIREGLEECRYNKIKWTGENMAIIDNWKGIHNRSDCSNYPDRELTRIYIS